MDFNLESKKAKSMDIEKKVPMQSKKISKTKDKR